MSSPRRLRVNFPRDRKIGRRFCFLLAAGAEIVLELQFVRDTADRFATLRANFRNNFLESLSHKSFPRNGRKGGQTALPAHPLFPPRPRALINLASAAFVNVEHCQNRVIAPRVSNRVIDALLLGFALAAIVPLYYRQRIAERVRHVLQRFAGLL